MTNKGSFTPKRELFGDRYGRVTQIRQLHEQAAEEEEEQQSEIGIQKKADEQDG
jgi:hypothetical protein